MDVRGGLEKDMGNIWSGKESLPPFHAFVEKSFDFIISFYVRYIVRIISLKIFANANRIKYG